MIENGQFEYETNKIIVSLHTFLYMGSYVRSARTILEIVVRGDAASVLDPVENQRVGEGTDEGWCRAWSGVAVAIEQRIV